MSKKYQGTIVYFFIKPLLQSFTSVDFLTLGYSLILFYLKFLKKNLTKETLILDQKSVFLTKLQRRVLLGSNLLDSDSIFTRLLTE